MALGQIPVPLLAFSTDDDRPCASAFVVTEPPLAVSAPVRFESFSVGSRCCPALVVIELPFQVPLRVPLRLFSAGSSCSFCFSALSSGIQSGSRLLSVPFLLISSGRRSGFFFKLLWQPFKAST